MAAIFRNNWALILLILLTASGVSGCHRETTSEEDDLGNAASTSGSKAPNTDLTGKIEIDGSSTVDPISEAAADQFQKQFPNVSVTIAISGTGNGFKRFSKGEIDIANASRPIKPDELQECQKNKVDFVELPVAFDGLTIVVNPANDWVDQLTVDQLKQIYGAGAAMKWSELKEGWPDLPIKVFSPGKASGTFDYFKEVVVGKEGSVRDDMSESEDDNVLVTGVGGEKGAIAYFGASYYFNKTRVRAVPIVNPSTGKAVAVGHDTIVNGEYAPFSRPLFIYVKVDSLRRPEMKKFVQYHLDEAATLATSVDYVPLTDPLYVIAQTHLKNRLTGSHYYAADGKKRSGLLSDVYKEENLIQGQ